MEEKQEIITDEVIVLEKFEGDPVPENLIERIHIQNGEVVEVETLQAGRVVSTEKFKEVN